MISTNQGFSSTFPIPLTRPHTALYLFILLEASGKCSSSGCYKHALEHLEAARSGKKWIFFLPATVNAWLLLTFLKACGWSGHIFGASASLRFLTKKKWLCHPLPLLFMEVSIIPNIWHSNCYCMQHSFVADDSWGYMLEPARISYSLIAIIVHS